MIKAGDRVKIVPRKGMEAVWRNVWRPLYDGVFTVSDNMDDLSIIKIVPVDDPTDYVLVHVGDLQPYYTSPFKALMRELDNL